MQIHGRKCFLLIGAVAGLFATPQAGAQTSNSVAASGFSYVFNGGAAANPTLTLYRGVTYIFNVNALGHPFFIQTNTAAAGAGQYNVGVTGNGAQTSILTFAVPASAPSTMFYACATHSVTFSMHGTLNILDPPAPPDGQIVLISLTPTTVTMKSLGATSWNAIPEYSSNLDVQAWTTVPGFSNVLANGTNTTMFGRLEPICGPNVFLRVRNQFP